MGHFIAFVLKLLLTGFLLIFVLGFGVIGLCAMHDVGKGGSESGLLLVILGIVGACLYGLFRLIGAVWSSKNSGASDRPPSDEA